MVLFRTRMEISASPLIVDPFAAENCTVGGLFLIAEIVTMQVVLGYFFDKSGNNFPMHLCGQEVFKYSATFGCESLDRVYSK